MTKLFRYRGQWRDKAMNRLDRQYPESRDLTPCSDLQTPPVIAIACMSREEIEGDAPDVEQL
jgi:hypothetical protein